MTLFLKDTSLFRAFAAAMEVPMPLGLLAKLADAPSV